MQKLRANGTQPSKRQIVFLRDGNRCVACGSSNWLTIDHIVPRSQGGSNEIDNLQTLCSNCNLVKGDCVVTLSELKEHLLKRGKYRRMKSTNRVGRPINELIKHCYNVHVLDLIEPPQFTYEEYRLFWLQLDKRAIYEMKNRDGSTEKCKVVYYPLPTYKDLRALVEIQKEGSLDLREVPIFSLIKIPANQ